MLLVTLSSATRKNFRSKHESIIIRELSTWIIGSNIHFQSDDCTRCR